MEAHAEVGTVAGVHAIAGGTAVSMASAAMSDGSRAAAARAVLTTTVLQVQPAAKQRHSLPWCSAEARHSMVRAWRLMLKPLRKQACTPLLAVSMPSAAMSDGSRAAAARIVSPPQRRSLLPRGLRACHGALPTLDTRW